MEGDTGDTGETQAHGGEDSDLIMSCSELLQETSDRGHLSLSSDRTPYRPLQSFSFFEGNRPHFATLKVDIKNIF